LESQTPSKDGEGKRKRKDSSRPTLPAFSIQDFEGVVLQQERSIVAISLVEEVVLAGCETDVRLRQAAMFSGCFEERIGFCLWE
jgi:hypothetical protein